MSNLHYSRNSLNQEGVVPSIFAVGDSWFWYPIPSRAVNLLEALKEPVRSREHVIFAVGNNGAEAFDFVQGKYLTVFKSAIDLYGDTLSSIWISAGGNDFAGENDLLPLLEDDCSAATTPEECFVFGPGGVEVFFQTIDAYYRAMIGYAYTRTPPNCHTVMHTYDYAIPNGKGLGRGKGWLRDAFVKAQVPEPLHQTYVKWLIDQHTRVLNTIAASDPDFLHVVDSRGVLAPTEWANELHPTGEGFRKIAEESWVPVLRSINLVA
jgi:hypothetical protein